jgi:hypothetical protein
MYDGTFGISGNPTVITTVVSATDVYTVTEVVWDEWLYGKTSPAGGISVSLESDFI